MLPLYLTRPFSLVLAMLLTILCAAVSFSQQRPTTLDESKALELFDEAQKLQKIQDLHGALQKYRQMLVVCDESGYVFGQYAANQGIGTVLFDQGQLREAEVAYEKTLELARGLQKQDLVCDSLFQLAVLNIDQGKFAEADKHLTEAARVAREAGIDTDSDVDILTRKGLAYLRKAIAPQSTQDTLPDVHSLGYFRERELLKGIACLKDAAIIAPASLRSIAVLYYHQELAENYFHLGEYQQALRQARIAGQITRSLPPAQKDMDAVDAFRILGDIHEALGNDDAALNTYNEAVSTLSDIPKTQGEEPDIPSSVPLKVYAGLARAHIRRREFAEAAKSLDAADNYARKMGKYGEMANMLGVARARGDLEYARGDNVRAAAEYQKTLDKRIMDIFLQGAVLTDADCAQTQGLTGAFSTEDRISFHTSLGRVLIGLQKPASALCQLSAAVSIIEQLRLSLDDLSLRRSIFTRKVEVYGSAVEALYQLHKQRKTLTDRNLLQFGTSPNAVAFHFSESGHARTFADKFGASLQQNYDVRKALPADLVEKERQIRANVNALLDFEHLPGVLEESGNAEARSQRLANARSELEQTIAKLRNENNVFSAALYPRPATWKEAASQLSTTENLVEYFVAPYATYCWVVTSDGTGEFFRIDITETDLRELVTRLRNPFDNGWRRFRDDALLRRLYDLLLEQPLKWIQQNRPKQVGSAAEPMRLIFVPDNVLYLFPFEILLASDQTFVGDKYITSYYPSATTMLQMGAIVSASNWTSEIMIIGDVLERGETVIVGGTQFGYLQYAKKEVEDLAALFGANSNCADVLTGRCADKAALLKRASQGYLTKYRFLHFSTHAFAHSANVEPSLILFPGPKPEDALLTMSEVPLLNLRADLVSLSACQTALGEELEPTPGEGIAGLSQAFFYAGTRSVLASLWEVDAEATSELMKNFYKRLRSQQGRPDKAAALFLARKDLSKSTRDLPYLWGAFILLGNSR
jgi:CHAT domain-containing protein/TolA-binding protein